jgi:hypothetical protein
LATSLIGQIITAFKLPVGSTSGTCESVPVHRASLTDIADCRHNSADSGAEWEI